MKAAHFSKDIQDFIRLLNQHHVRYLIAGVQGVRSCFLAFCEEEEDPSFWRMFFFRSVMV